MDTDFFNQRNERVALVRYAGVSIEGSASSSAVSTAKPVPRRDWPDLAPRFDNQVFFEDVEVGENIPSVVKPVSQITIIKWAAAMNDYGLQHFDHCYMPPR